MDNKTICSIRKGIEYEKNILIDQLINLKKEETKLKKICKHDLIVLLSDNHPRRIMLTSTGYCPICNRKARIYPSRELKDTYFKNSKIIDLTDINVMDKDTYFKDIQAHILSNYDYYYNQDISQEELQQDIMENIKLPIQTKTLKRIWRDNIK